MKQTIEIEVPDGKIAIWKDNKVIFEDIKPQLPKTWKEFCNSFYIDKEYFINISSEILEYSDEFRQCNSDKNILPSETAAKQHLALMQLHQLRDCYRQGWKPDWNDRNIKFYIFHWNYQRNGVYSTYNIPYFLTFQTEELAEEFLKNFRDLIEQAGDLI